MEARTPRQLELPAWQRSSADELLNAATHGFGLALAVVGALVMAGGVAADGDAWRIIGCGVYLASLVTVYAMSTLSHTVTSPSWKSLFRRLDQGFIYLLIAATYTPFSLAYLRSGLWWALLGAMWSVALFGFAAKVFFAHRVEAVSIASYILLGWMPIVAAPALDALDADRRVLVDGGRRPVLLRGHAVPDERRAGPPFSRRVARMRDRRQRMPLPGHSHLCGLKEICPEHFHFECSGWSTLARSR